MIAGSTTLRGVLLLALLATMAHARSAEAQALQLSVTPMAIVLPGADPDTVPVLTSAPVQVSYRITGNANRPWLLTILAAGDLISETSVLDIGQVSWTATPSPPFQNGSLSPTLARTLAAGTGNVNPGAGTLTFQLANSWDYDAGVYVQTITFTLSTP